MSIEENKALIRHAVSCCLVDTSNFNFVPRLLHHWDGEAIGKVVREACSL